MSKSSLFKNDLLKEFSLKDYPFHRVIGDLFGIKNLSQFHINCKKSDQYNQDLGKDSNSYYHSLFYKNIKQESSSLRILWDKFLENVVATHFIKEKPLIVQALPSLRIHIPKAKAINRWHFDSDKDHNHPLGEINCLLPLTNMSGNNSVWRESEPNQEDFKSFDLSLGQMVYWNGNVCTHGNNINDTNITRLSLDFRVFPRKKYLEHIKEFSKVEKPSATTGLKFKIGSYYKEIS